MDLDERLKYLVISTESLHNSCQELHAAVARQGEQIAAAHEKSERLRVALYKGIASFLKEEGNGQNGDGEE